MKTDPAKPCQPSLIRDYMPELDSVRGIAILSVLLFHGMARPLQGELSTAGQFVLSVTRYGWAGVNLFFVLSGFLITGILLDTNRRPDYFRRFYFRRALRILPAFYGLLLILLIGRWISFPFAAVSVLFLANFAGALGVAAGYGPLWSLAVEEHFYLFWPLMVRRWSARKLMLVAAGVATVSPLLRVLNLIGHPAGSPPSISLYTWFNLDGLALGALLAIWLREPSFHRRRLALIAAPATLVGALAFFFLAGRPWADATVATTACNLASAGFLSCVLLIGTSKWKFLIDRPILRFFGFISYGLYLIHVLAFHLSEKVLSRQLEGLIVLDQPFAATLLRFIMGLGLGVAIAYLSRHSLEEIFLRIGRRPRRELASSAAGALPTHSVVSDSSPNYKAVA